MSQQRAEWKLTVGVIAALLITFFALMRFASPDDDQFALFELIGEIGLTWGVLLFYVRSNKPQVTAVSNVVPPVSDSSASFSPDAVLEISELRRKQKLLIERAVDVILTIDTNANIVSINDACRKAWGYQRSELVGKSVSVVLESSEFERVKVQILGGMQSIDKVVFESQVRCKDGSLVDVVWTGHWSATEGGLFCIVHDISQQKLIEKAIRQSEQRLRAILESLPAGVLVVDNANKIEFANESACSLLGYEAKDFPALSFTNVFPEAAGIEAEARAKSGAHVPVALSRNQITLSDGDKQICVFVDKRAERELERTRREFAAMVTHDLKTPLSAIMNVFTILDSQICGSISDQATQLVRTSQKQLEHTVRLLDDMLQVASMDAGTFELACTDIALDELVVHAAATMQPQAESRGVAIKTEVVPCICFADEQRLAQVLINLLSNAIKYSNPNSTIVVKVETNEGKSLISVKDEGRGIPAHKVGHIFERFGQVDNSDAREKGGYGLGLAICKTIVEQHGGEIGVESREGHGSTFWFSIPLHVTDEALSLANGPS